MAGKTLVCSPWKINFFGRLRSFRYPQASVVTRYGIRLLPEMYERLNPIPYEATAQMEQDLADDLRRAGYMVTGGH